MLREFKTHLSWSSLNNLAISIRYFYVPRAKRYVSSDGNAFIDSADPSQLDQDQDNSSTDDPTMFCEWKIPDADLVSVRSRVVCPPAAASVLIVVSVTSTTKSKQKRKQPQSRNKDNELTESDTDNGHGMAIPEVEEKANHSEEGIIGLLFRYVQEFRAGVNGNAIYLFMLINTQNKIHFIQIHFYSYNIIITKHTYYTKKKKKTFPT